MKSFFCSVKHCLTWAVTQPDPRKNRIAVELRRVENLQRTDPWAPGPPPFRFNGKWVGASKVGLTTEPEEDGPFGA